MGTKHIRGHEIDLSETRNIIGHVTIRFPVAISYRSSIVTKSLLDKCMHNDGAISRARTLRNCYSLHTTFVCSDFLINFVVTVSVARRPNI